MRPSCVIKVKISKPAVNGSHKAFCSYLLFHHQHFLYNLGGARVHCPQDLAAGMADQFLMSFPQYLFLRRGLLFTKRRVAHFPCFIRDHVIQHKTFLYAVKDHAILLFRSFFKGLLRLHCSVISMERIRHLREQVVSSGQNSLRHDGEIELDRHFMRGAVLHATLDTPEQFRIFNTRVYLHEGIPQQSFF